MVTSAEVIYKAQTQVGILAGPNNTNPYSDWYQATYPINNNDFRGEAWCAMFVSWCWNKAGLGLQFYYCPTGVNAFKFYNLFSDVARPGSAIFYDWNGDGVADHVGLVEMVTMQAVYTIEGNTGSPDGVWREMVGPGGTRDYSEVLGYGHPVYG